MNQAPKALSDFFAFFESQESSFEFSLFNNLSSLISHIKYTPVFIAAKNAVISNPKSHAPIVVNRAEKLLNEKTVKKYRHEYDGALAADVLLLTKSSTNKAKTLIHKIKSKGLVNLWWANLMIEYSNRVIPNTKSIEKNIKHEAKIQYKTSIEKSKPSIDAKTLSNSIIIT